MSLICLGNKLYIIVEKTQVQGYDFDFELHFETKHPYRVEGEQSCVLRIGAIDHYERYYAENLALGLKLVNAPKEHERASELAQWYSYLADLTPKSICVNDFPSVEEIEAMFLWPVFLKGSHQTSQHDPSLSIIQSPDHYREVIPRYKSDRILHWQKIAIREFVQLQPVRGEVPGKIRPSLEFRSFWWHGNCVGCGQYWSQVPEYSAPDLEKGLAVAGDAASRLGIPFLVIDFAKTIDQRWLLIECNDAQESGYAGVLPHQLWSNVLDQLRT